MKLFAYSVRTEFEKECVKKEAARLGAEVTVTEEYPCTENAELAKGYDGISIITNPLDAELLDRFYELGVRAVSTRSIGYEHIDVEYAKKLGMRVANVSYSPNSVANYTIMLMLMACRKLPYIMKKDEVQDFSLSGKMGKELSLCTVGVIGTGKIGETVIAHLSGFGCRILAYDLYEKEPVKQYAEYVDLDALYRESDIITIHVPGMEENRHMISDDAFAKMKDGVILINAARGMVMDSEALMRALDSGKVGYAALDTIEDERGLYYLNHEGVVLGNRERSLLKGYSNVLLLPHMAFYTDQAISDMVGNSIRALAAFARGEDSPFEV